MVALTALGPPSILANVPALTIDEPSLSPVILVAEAMV
jgi:hypothetical protein